MIKTTFVVFFHNLFNNSIINKANYYKYGFKYKYSLHNLKKGVSIYLEMQH